MATLEQMAASVPAGTELTAKALAKLWWPDADWLDVRTCRHNGGPRKGARVAAGMAGRMRRRGLLSMRITDDGATFWTKVEVQR